MLSKIFTSKKEKKSIIKNVDAKAMRNLIGGIETVSSEVISEPITTNKSISEKGIK